jgi:hypothetical protein
MQIDKSQIIDFIRSHVGDQQKAQQAEQELPGQVDTDNPEHQNLLQRFGVNPQQLIQQFMGGGGGGGINIPGLGGN